MSTRVGQMARRLLRSAWAITTTIRVLTDAAGSIGATSLPARARRPLSGDDTCAPPLRVISLKFSLFGLAPPIP